jgi:hypothetical protein
MTTFDYNQVQSFVNQLAAKLEACQEDDAQCDSMDTMLSCCADHCLAFAEHLRKWARGVFEGRIAYDEAASGLWYASLLQLFQRAVEIGQEAESPCGTLPGEIKLEAALWNLYRLIDSWVEPKLAVGPSARQNYPKNIHGESPIRAAIAGLQKLPHGWVPSNRSQARIFRKAKI